MSERRASLNGVSTNVLERLREALAAGALATPLTRDGLVAFGLREGLDAIGGALGGHRTAACLAVLDVTLAERADRRPPPELVWTGPDTPAGLTRDTAVVLRELFEGARSSVVLAGYSFRRSTGLLQPLHAVMRDHGVDATFFMHVPQVESATASPAAHLDRELGGFFREEWTFGPPYPRVYYDPRALRPGPPYSSLHAKCVSVDGSRAFVSSANFTARAHEHNVEVGVLLTDAAFAEVLAGQWLRLIDAGLFVRWEPRTT